MIKHY